MCPMLVYWKVLSFCPIVMLGRSTYVRRLEGGLNTQQKTEANHIICNTIKLERYFTIRDKKILATELIGY